MSLNPFVQTRIPGHDKNVNGVFDNVETNDWVSFFHDLINVFIIPCVITISFVLNLICITVFSSSTIKSTIYKYLSANAIADCITLLVALLGLFVKMTENTNFYPTSYVSAQYFFVFISFTTLTISNFIKLILALDRIFRLKRKCKWFVKKHSFKWIIGSIIVLSSLLNCPKLIFSELYTLESQKYNFLNLNVTTVGNGKIKGPLLITSTAMLEIVPFITIIVLNVILIVIVRNLLKKFLKLEESSTYEDDSAGHEITKRKKISFNVYDDDESDDEDTVEIVVIANIDNENTIESEPKSEQMEVTMEKKEKDVSNQAEIEITRFSLTKMLFIMLLVYILGHILFVICSIFIQVKYFFYFEPIVNLLQKNSMLIEMIISIAYLFLYTSFGANFFVYFTFNGLFRRLVSKRGMSKSDLEYNSDDHMNHFNNR